MYILRSSYLLATFLICIIAIACNTKKTAPENITEQSDTTNAKPIIPPALKDSIIESTELNKIAEKAGTPLVKPDVSGKGTVVLKGDIWIIRTTGPDGTDYLPTNLEKSFQVDGKSVTFEANLDEIPPGVRMAGRPITLISIN